jgi:RND family efflux transporter MFP subunit
MTHARIALAAALLAGLGLVAFVATRDAAVAEDRVAPAAVLSVAMVRAESSRLALRVAATGRIAAWQEASVGAEVDGLRLIAVSVNVGDAVARGQVLARFNADIVESELAQARAAVAQAEAEVVEADANARRAEGLTGSGAISQQQAGQYAAAAMTARARLAGVRALEKTSRLRVAQTRVLAPDDGVISSRSATVGAVVPAGQELFRLISDGRLEWRAQVRASDLGLLAPGQIATISVEGSGSIQGELRMVAPVIDAQTLDGLAYVDLPRDATLRAGAFARGYVEIGDSAALTLPQTAVVMRDGFHYVMRVGPDSAVMLTKVSVGRRVGERIEIAAGLPGSEPVIASGLGFLAEGDTVRVVDDDATADAATQAAPAAAPAARGSRPGGDS